MLTFANVTIQGYQASKAPKCELYDYRGNGAAGRGAPRAAGARRPPARAARPRATVHKANTIFDNIGIL